MSGFTVRVPTDAEIADRGENMTTHINMTSTSDWEPAVPDFAAREAALAASMSSDYKMRHLQSWALNPLQVRGQDCLTPSVGDKLEFAALLDSESKAADTRRELAAVQMEEMEELSRPLYGGIFANKNNLDFDFDKAHFDQDKRKIQPREASSLA
jgi:hypothetical protein